MYGTAKGYDDYRQNHILTAPPERLLVMLVEALSLNVNKARAAILSGDVPTRRECLQKARSIVMELINTLDFEIGGTIAVNLHRMYTYVNFRLVRADAKNKVEAIDEALVVIKIIEDTWRQAVDNVQREKAAAARAAR